MKTFLLIATIGIQAFSVPTHAVELIGKTTSMYSIYVVSEVSGIVETAHWQIGDLVAANSPLATIKAQDFKLEVLKQKANVTLVEADLNINKSTYSRYQELRAKNSLSQNELDVAKADYAASKANVVNFGLWTFVFSANRIDCNPLHVSVVFTTPTDFET